MMSSEHIVSQLRNLIDGGYIKQIQVYRFYDKKLHNESELWVFGHEYLQIGDQSYNLNRLVTFQIIDHILRLYF